MPTLTLNPLVPTQLGVTNPAQGDLFGFDGSGWRPVSMGSNARLFGATGDGTTDDALALGRMLTAGSGKHCFLPAGTYVFSSPLAIPANTTVHLMAGAHLLCKVTGGVNAITLADGASLVSQGRGSNASKITVHSTANVAAVVANAATDGTQEYAYIEGPQFVVSSSAVVATAVINLVSAFVNSGIRDVVINCNSTAPTGIRLAGGSVTGFGPVYMQDVWVTASTSHGIVITETNPSHGAAMAWLDRVTCENQLSGGHGIFLQGFGGLQNCQLRNIHTENGNATAATTAAIYIDGAKATLIDGFDVYATPIANKSGLIITNNVLNTGIRVAGIVNSNLVTPVIDDQKNSFQYGAVNPPPYCTPDVGIFPSAKQTLTYAATVNTNLALGNICEIDVTNGTAFTIANPTNAREGQLLMYEIVNASGGVMGAITWGGNFAYRDAFTNPANGKRKYVTFVSRGGGNWAQIAAATGDM